MAVAILLFGRFVGALAMPALAGLLIVVGFRTLKPERIVMVWQTGAVQQAVMALTFFAALFIPLQYAVLLGVALAVMLYVFQQSNKVTVKAWEIGPGQYPVEKVPPSVVPADQVTTLMPAVSYTHLDVYKRQDQWHAAGRRMGRLFRRTQLPAGHQH